MLGKENAGDVVTALAGDPTASLLFTAQSDGAGTGLIDTTDIAVTTGGAAVAAPNNPTVGDRDSFRNLVVCIDSQDRTTNKDLVSRGRRPLLLRPRRATHERQSEEGIQRSPSWVREAGRPYAMYRAPTSLLRKHRLREHRKHHSS